MDDLRLLRHFEAVYRLLSFSAAAEELGLTHSAITKSIKILEQDWGAILFHRTTRNVVATEAGKKLYPRAVELLAFAASVRGSVLSGEHELHILCGAGVIEGVIHPAIVKFSQRYPETRIHAMALQPHQAAEELIQRRVHLLIYHDVSLASMPHKDRMRVTKVIDESYWIIHRPGHPVSLRPHSQEEVMKYRWALAFGLPFEGALPGKLRRLLKENGVPHYRLLSQTACIELVKQTDILTTLPQSAAHAAAAKGEVGAIPLPGKFRFSISAAVLQDAGREPTVEHFIECL